MEKNSVAVRALRDMTTNSFFLQRLSDESPLNSHYPYGCSNAYSAGAFLKGTVWGIDEGWSSQPLLWNANVRLPNGRYIAKVSITSR